MSANIRAPSWFALQFIANAKHIYPRDQMVQMLKYNWTNRQFNQLALRPKYTAWVISAPFCNGFENFTGSAHALSKAWASSAVIF